MNLSEKQISFFTSVSISVVIFLTLSGSTCYCQNQLVDSVLQKTETDSMYKALSSLRDDTVKVNRLNTFSEKIRMLNQYDSANSFGLRALAIATKLRYNKGIAEACRNLGVVSSLRGDYPKAQEYSFKALAINREAGNKRGEVRNMGTIGYAYFQQGQLDKALDFEFKALEMAREIKDSDAEANMLSTLGDIYFNQGDYSKSLNFDFEALAIKKGLGDQRGISRNYYLISNIYQSQGNFDKALEYCNQALAINNKLGNKFTIAINLNSMGEIYRAEKKYNEALTYFNNSLALNKEIGAQKWLAVNLGNIGNTYSLMGDDIKNNNKAKDTLYSNALAYYTRALTLMEGMGSNINVADDMYRIANIYAKRKNYGKARALADSSLLLALQTGQKEAIRNAYRLKSTLDSATGLYKAGWDDYKQYIIYRDSLMKELNEKKTLQAEMNYQFEQKQALEKAEQEKKDLQSEQDRKKQAMILDFFVAGFLMVLALAFFIFRGYRHKQQANVIITKQKAEVEKQRDVVEQQKGAIEEKQKEILDSIHYAQRIQNALLASDSLLKANLKEYFIFFKPKDIVSGDFYWATEKDNKFYLAVCDSTGHGVPGAFMSLLNMSFMNEAVNEKNIHSPHQIFNHTRKRLIEHISQNGGQDGMDGILMELSTGPLSLRYSAAINLPLLIRNNKLIELNTDKMPVGASPKEGVPFQPYSVELMENDLIYAFTDGFSDQFGGAKGKKYKYRELCDKLLSIYMHPMHEQKQFLEEEFLRWKGELEQVDDVLVVGIKV